MTCSPFKTAADVTCCQTSGAHVFLTDPGRAGTSFRGHQCGKLLPHRAAKHEGVCREPGTESPSGRFLSPPRSPRAELGAQLGAPLRALAVWCEISVPSPGLETDTISRFAEAACWMPGRALPRLMPTHTHTHLEGQTCNREQELIPRAGLSQLSLPASRGGSRPSRCQAARRAAGL